MATPKTNLVILSRLGRSVPMLALVAGLSVGTGVPMVGCQSTSSGLEAVDMASKLFGDWDLSSLAGVDLSALLGQGGKVPGLSFGSDGGVSGFAGVNRLASKVDLAALANGQFKLAPSAVTRMAGEPAAMNLENAFLEALTKVDSFDVKGDTLTLSQGASRLMEFVRRK